MSNILDIIIPMYNTPKEYISRALTSISRQKNVDFKEIGVILIDDASTKIKYKKSYFKQGFPKLNITLLQNKVNSGAGVTRQNGIDVSTAEYVTFLDSDDEFCGNEALFKVITLMKDPRVSTDRIQTAFFEETKDEYGELITIRHGVEFSCLHGLFLKKSFLDKYNIRFHPTLRYHEDVYYVSIEKKLSLDSFAFLDEVTYVWKWNDNSLVRTIKTEYNNFEQRFTALVDLNRFLRDTGVDYYENVMADSHFLAMMLCSNLFEIPYYKNIKEEYDKKFYDYVKEFKIYNDVSDNNKDLIERNLKVEQRPYPWIKMISSINDYMKNLEIKYGKFED